METIKFRAFNKNNNDWESSFAVSNDGIFMRLGVGQKSEGIEIMQFTGLLDKNGKEIYEGDIVFDEDGEFSKTCKIEWHNENAQFVGVDIDGLGGFQMEEIDGEIIGNIYENPELLSNPVQ